MRSERLAFGIALALLAGCAGSGGSRPGPATTKQVATLEEVRPEDRAAMSAAQKLVETGQFAEAVAALEKLVPANPECARVVLLLPRDP